MVSRSTLLMALLVVAIIAGAAGYGAGQQWPLAGVVEYEYKIDSVTTSPTGRNPYEWTSLKSDLSQGWQLERTISKSVSRSTEFSSYRNDITEYYLKRAKAK